MITEKRTFKSVYKTPRVKIVLSDDVILSSTTDYNMDWFIDQPSSIWEEE